MKYYVKRDRYGSFQKAKLELEAIHELTAIRMALDHYAMYMEKHALDNDEKLGDLYATIDSIRRKIDFEKELPW